MTNIDVYIPPEAFFFLMRNSTDRIITKDPKIVIYYKKRTGELGQAVLNYETAFTFAGMCKFPTYKDKTEYLDEFLPSLKRGFIEKKVNYRWRTYSWKTM